MSRDSREAAESGQQQRTDQTQSPQAGLPGQVREGRCISCRRGRGFRIRIHTKLTFVLCVPNPKSTFEPLPNGPTLTSSLTLPKSLSCLASLQQSGTFPFKPGPFKPGLCPRAWRNRPLRPNRKSHSRRRPYPENGGVPHHAVLARQSGDAAFAIQDRFRQRADFGRAAVGGGAVFHGFDEKGRVGRRLAVAALQAGFLGLDLGGDLLEKFRQAVEARNVGLPVAGRIP